MTLGQVKLLSRDELNLKIAKLCGWYRIFLHPPSPSGFAGEKIEWKMPSDPCNIPNYLVDGNARHDMFKANPMTQEQEECFENNLGKLMQHDNPDIPHTGRLKFWYATPLQLCEAFVMTMMDFAS